MLILLSCCRCGCFIASSSAPVILCACFACASLLFSLLFQNHPGRHLEQAPRLGFLRLHLVQLRVARIEPSLSYCSPESENCPEPPYICSIRPLRRSTGLRSHVHAPRTTGINSSLLCSTGDLLCLRCEEHVYLSQEPYRQFPLAPPSAFSTSQPPHLSLLSLPQYTPLTPINVLLSFPHPFLYV